MSTSSQPPKLPPAVGSNPASAPVDPAAKWIEYEDFIEAQLKKTRSHVRAVDIADSLMTLAAGTLGYFFVAAMIDHWVVAGGLGFWGRLLLLAAYLLATGYYLVLHVFPLLFRRINPVYAAETIERSRPTLKNALINFLFFREDPDSLTPTIYQAVEEQAATNLARMRLETAVDRSRLIKIGYLLLGILLVGALYTLFSPKDLFRTVGRVIMPWAEIAAPTQTAITEIEPGDVQAFRGQQIEVSARIAGLPKDGKVTLVYTMADGQVVDRAVEMHPQGAGSRYACTLPDGSSSLEQSLEYRLLAGDAITRKYKLEVVSAPTLVVQAIEYKYPAYTGLIPQRVEHQGDIRAIEGTQVTIEALANQDIASAHVDFEGDKKLDQRMQSEGQQAKATFRLALKDDRRTPEHTSYELVFKNDRGQQNVQPARHPIVVTPDVSPEIQIVTPKSDQIEVPLSGWVDLEIGASDPDFALRTVKVSGLLGKRQVLDKTLLDESWRGQWLQKFRFEPQALKLKVGDIVEVMAVAEDNKDPRPNRVESGKRWIKVVTPGGRDQGQTARNNQGAEGGQPGEENPRAGDNREPRPPQDPGRQPNERRDGQADNRNQSEPDPSQQAAQDRDGEKQGDGNQASRGDRGAGQQAAKSADNQAGKFEASERDSAVPSDGSDDADAFQRILKHQEQQAGSDGSKQPAGSNGGDGAKGDPQNGAGAQEKNQSQEAGREQGAGDQRGDNQPSKNGPQQPAGDRSQKPGDSAQQNGNSKQQAGDKSGPSGEKNAADKNGETRSASPQSKDARDQQGASNSPDGKQPSAEKSGKNDAGKQPAGRDPQNGKQEQRSGGKPEQQPGEKNDVGKSGNEKQPGGSKDEKSAGEKQPGQQSNEKGSGEKSDGAGEKSDGAGQQSEPKDGAENSGEQSGQQGDSARDQKQPSDANGQASGANSKPDPSGKSGQQPKPSERGQGDGNESASPDQNNPAGETKPGGGERGQRSNDQTGGERSTQEKQNTEPAGAGEKPQGGSGAGQEGRDNRGSPSPQQANQPKPQTGRDSQSEKDPKAPGEAQSPSTSKKQSDTKGADDGDRSGAGKQGGGQKATKSGTGEAGQNAPADEGAGRSDEAGAGENANRAGGNRESKDPTGQSGGKAGEGSASRPATDKNQPGQPGQGNQKSTPDQAQGQPPAAGQQPGEGTPGPGDPHGGKPNDTAPNQTWKPTPDKADDPNLEYTKQATDLALQRLKDELRKENPDPELLKQLGWTPKDLANFVKRWEDMRKAAQAPGDAGKQAQRELDESLQSLGLRPRSTALKSNAARDDQARGVKETRRTDPPAEYSEQYKSYLQGNARGGK